MRGSVLVIGALIAALCFGAANEAAAQPAISLVTPGSVTYGVTTTSSITISGSGFQLGDRISVGSLTGTTVTGSTATAITPFVFASASTLRFYWANTSLAPGIYNVVVTNPSSGNSATASGGFTVVAPQPTISLVNPASVTYGVTTSRAVTIDGTNFVAGATVALGSLTGVTVTGTTATAGVPFVRVSATRVSVWWANTGLAPGAYPVTVTNPTAAGTLSGNLTPGFTVVAPQPTISLVNPASVTYGVTTSRAVTIDGTNFVAGATIALGSLTGVTVTGTTATAGVPFVRVSATRVSVWWANTGLAPGAYPVTVTNPTAAGTLSGNLTPGFTVVAPQPTISLVNPASVTYGVTTSRAVTIDGTNFVAGATVALGSLTGVTVTGTTATAGVPFVRVSATRVSVWWANTGLAPGAYPVTVTNPTAAGELRVSVADGFTVTEASSTILQVNPSTATYGVTTSRAISIDGTSFVVGATVLLASPNPTTSTTITGVTVAGSTATAANPFVHVSATRISVWWANTDLTPGTYTVTITNPAAAGGESVSLVAGFTVVAPDPTISLVNPASVTYGVTASRAVAVDGTNFVAGATVTIGSLTGVTVAGSTATAANPYVHVSATRVSVWWDNTALPPLPALGAYDVVVTNPTEAGGESVTRTAGFAVEAPDPTISLVNPASVTYGVTASRALAISGADFVLGATVTIGSLTGETVAGSTATAANPFVHVAATRVSVWWDNTALLPLPALGAYDVVVTNPMEAGGRSVTRTAGFTVEAPVPEITRVNPSTVEYNVTASTIIRLTGTNFFAPNGLDLPTVLLVSDTYGPVHRYDNDFPCVAGSAGTASATRRCVHISRTAVEFYWEREFLRPGTYDLTVINPAYAGAASNDPPAVFEVTAPLPVIQSVRPVAVVAAISASRAVDVVGVDDAANHRGFVAGATLSVIDPGKLNADGTPSEENLVDCETQLGTTPTEATRCVYVGPGLLRFYWDTDRAAALSDPFLGPGTYTVTVTNPASRGELSGTLDPGRFRVLVDPELVRVEPTGGVGAGARSAVLTLTTAGFPAGSVMRIGVAERDPADLNTPPSRPFYVQVQDPRVTMRSGFRAYATGDGGTVVIDVADDPAQTTNRELAVTITSPDGRYRFTCPDPGGAGTCDAGLTITPSPVVTGITPALGAGSSGRTLTIAGDRFVSGAVVTLPTGVTVTGSGSCAVSSATEIACSSVAVAASVQPGPASVVVTNPDGGRTTGTMTITAPPVITSVTSASGSAFTAGTTVRARIIGSGFQDIPTVVSTAGVTVNNRAFVSAEEVDADFVVAAGAADGYRSLTLTNPDGGVAIAPQAFYVGTPPADTISAMATFGQLAPSSVQYRRSLGIGWSGNLPGPALSFPPVWQVMKASPIRDEHVLAVVDTQRSLSLHVWNGQAWGGALSATVSTGVARPSQTVDVAIEQRSGRGLVVYAVTADTTLRYRVWDGAAWSAEALVEDPVNGQPTSGRPLWVRLESRPTTNDVVLVYGDQNDAIGSVVWRGDSGLWEDAVLLTSAAASHEAPIFDVAFERGTGRAMVVWATGTETTPHYRIWSRDASNVGGWQSEGIAPSIRVTTGESTATLRALRAVGDASNSNTTVTNRIVMAASSGTTVPALEALAWDGIQWSTSTHVLTATLRAYNGTRGFDLVSQGASGDVVAVYATTASPNTVSQTYAVANGTWSSGETNVSLPASPTPTSSVPAWTELASSRGVNDVALTQFDSLGRVVLARWSGTAWSAAVEARPLGSGLVSVFDPTVGRTVSVPGKGTAVTLVTLDQNLTGRGIDINPTSATVDLIPPGTPTLSAGAATINAVTLSWIAVASDGVSTGSSVTTYELEQILGSATTTRLVAASQPPGGTETYAVTGLFGAHTYLFSIRAVDAAGNRSSWSDRVTVTTPSAAPPPVTGLQVPTGSISRTSVTLVWPRPTFENDNAALASYIVKYKTVGTFASDAEFDATTTGTTSLGESVTISGLQFGVTYWFGVKVVDVLGNSSVMSNIVSATTTDHAPDPITDLRVIAIPSDTSVTLRWTMPADDYGPIASYVVKYTSVATIGTILTDAEFNNTTQVITVSGQPTRDSTVTPPIETITVTSLTPATEYWFAVKAVDAQGQQSPLSGSPSATTSTTNVNPLDVTAPAAVDLTVVPSGTTSTSLTVAWTATGDDGTVGTAAEYDLRYATFPLTAQTFTQGLRVSTSLPAASGRPEQLTLVGLSSNTQYFVAINVMDEAGNATLSTLPVDQPAQTGLRRGYTLVSIPKVLSPGSDTVSDVFVDDIGTSVLLYRWRSQGVDVDTGCYDGYPSPFTYDSAYTCSAIGTVGTGLGYYVYNPAESTGGRSVLDASGVAVTAPTFQVPLALGFNIVGNPYQQDIPLSAVRVQRGSAGTPESYQTAIDNGWVGPSLLLFDGVVSRPYDVSEPAAVLKPWNGGWIQSFVSDAVLVFSSP